SIAHDLRAPLRAVGGFSNELCAEYGAVLDETGRSYLNRISAAAARMDQLILDLLRFGRLNTAELPSETVRLAELVPKVLVQVNDEIQSKHAQVQVNEPLLPVQANAVMVEQVLVNLFDNAMKFVTPDVPPRLEIWTEKRTTMVRLCV